MRIVNRQEGEKKEKCVTIIYDTGVFIQYIHSLPDAFFLLSCIIIHGGYFTTIIDLKTRIL